MYFPGTFTNQIQTAFREPRLLIVADTRADHQPITESSYANIPVMAFCNIDSPTRLLKLFFIPSTWTSLCFKLITLAFSYLLRVISFATLPVPTQVLRSAKNHYQ
jgi:ribosomal protein S2